MIHRPLSAFILPEDNDTYYLYLTRLLKTGAAPKCELRMVKKDGGQFWAKLDAAAVLDTGGAPGYRVVLTDITERKQLEETQLFLLHSGSHRAGDDFFATVAQYLARHLDMGYVCIDRLEGDGLTAQTLAIYNEGKYEANVSYALKDTPCGTVVGQTICCFPEDVCQLFPQDAALQELQAESYIGTTLWSFDGKPIGLIAIIGRKPLRNRGLAEAMLKLVAIRAASELERKGSEDQIRKLSRAVEQSPTSIVITDLKGGIEYVNPKFTQVTGYTLAEACGQNPRILKGGKTTPEEYRHLWQTITQGGEWRGELHNRKKNGELYWEFASISPLVDAQGQITHFLAVKEDITERRVLEEQLRQTQKLNSIGQLAGGVAHDFNNILAAMMLNLDYLRENTSLDAETQGSLKELMKGAQRAANLTRQLLLFGRRSVMEMKVLDLNELVTNLLKMLGRLIGENITVRYDQQEFSCAVAADAGMLEQVLTNLAVNARDAMPKGGKLTIAIEPVQIKAERARGIPGVSPGKYVCLSVADTGCGMDEATQKRIFEPFFTTKEFGKGTGLGLATTHGIVTQHKGWVEVVSEVGKGTTFKVFLPAITKVKPTPAEIRKSALRGGHETILVVEDEAMVRNLLVLALRRLGYRVLEANDGQSALRVWEEETGKIDLLFSDMVMPEGLTGLDLAQQMQAMKPGLKVIISSGYNEEMVVQNQPNSGAIVYLQKPYLVEVLAKTVRDCLER
jgi:PAS domain S-box-containing protein